MMRTLRIFAVLLLAVSCGTAREVRTAADRVWDYSREHPDGFTVELDTMEQPEEGIAVAYHEGAGYSKKDLKATVKHARMHDGHVGGWLDGRSGTYVFDSVRLFPEDSLDAAYAFARDNAQEAFYIISSGREVRLTDGPGEEYSQNTLIIMCDESVGKDPLRKAVGEYGAKIVYDYSIINGMAVRIPEGKAIKDAIAFFREVPGVVSVERDRIYHLVEPVRPTRLEVM